MFADDAEVRRLVCPCATLPLDKGPPVPAAKFHSQMKIV